MVLIRTLVYATFFMGFTLVFLPAEILRRAGVRPPVDPGVPGGVGALITATGAGLTAWCVLTFVFRGRGTPFPIDPPRRLVTRGPYGIIRNPMYVGAGAALAGAALYYRSVALAAYAALFLLLAHLFVILYEEPTLARMFGAEYEAYRRSVGRWIPRRSKA